MPCQDSRGRKRQEKSTPEAEKEAQRMENGLLLKLKKYNTTMLPMHMPGHKRNPALSGKGGYLEALCADCDITEIAGFDNLAEPRGILFDLKKRAAALWHSKEAYPLVNGSTAGILAGIYAMLQPGDTVLMARNCHKSVYNGVRLSGANVRYLLPEVEPVTGICGEITPAMVEKACEGIPDIKLVIVTSPTYEGVISDVEGICQVAHTRGIPVLVDSAHGAHLGFEGFPEGATTCGADLVVHSLHKTLPCLTQTAMLHRNGDLVDGGRLQEAVNLFQTSSPSYLLLASMEGCIGLLEERGKLLFQEWQAALNLFYKEVQGLQSLSVLGAEEDNTCLPRPGQEEKVCLGVRDMGKLILCTGKTGLTGAALMERLRTEYHIEVEMAAERYVLAMTGMGDTKESLKRLADALRRIDKGFAPENQSIGILETIDRGSLLPYPEQVCSIAAAMQRAGTEKQLEAAAGDVAAEHIWAYPPGIPLVVAGERITKELAAYLEEKVQNGVELHKSDGTMGEMLTIKVMEREM